MKNKIIGIIIVLFLLLSIDFVNNTVNAESEIPDGEYTIVSAINNIYSLDVEGASKNNGVNIQLWSNAQTSNQKLYLKSNPDGYYTITAMHSGKAMETSRSRNYARN